MSDGCLIRFVCTLSFLLWLLSGIEGDPELAHPAPSRQKLGTEAAQTLGQANINHAAPNAANSLNHLEEDLARGQTESARRDVEELLQHRAIDPDILLTAGVNLAQHDLFDVASNVFSRSVRDYPNLFEGYYNLALAELALGKTSAALDSIERSPHDTPEKEIMRTYLLGKIEAAAGRPIEAERDLSAAFRAAPEEENYVLDLGLFYLKQQSYPKATSVFAAGTATSPSSTFIFFGLSLAQFLGGQLSESIRSCDKVLELDKDFSPARTLLAFVLCMAGRYQEAMQVADAGLRSGKSFPYLYYVHALAQIKLQSRDYDVMLRDLDFASKNIPACSLCYLSRSKVHQAMGRSDDATRDLEQALRLNPSLAEAWYRLASLYKLAGREDDSLKARTQFEKLKAEKSTQDTEMIRKAFIQAMEGSQ